MTVKVFAQRIRIIMFVLTFLSSFGLLALTVSVVIDATVEVFNK